MSTLGTIREITSNKTTAFLLISALAGIGYARITEGEQQ